jgi:hypothetical protein
LRHNKARFIIYWQVVSLEQVVNSLRQENALLNRGMFKLVSNLQEEKQKLAEVRICLILNAVSKKGGGSYGFSERNVEFSNFCKLDLNGWGFLPGACKKQYSILTH